MALSSRVSAMLLAGCVLTPAASQAQSVSGAFTLDGKPTQPKHAAAFRIRNQNAARTLETYVMLTSTPVDVKKISSDIDPYMVAINDPAAMNADYLAFQVSDKGETRINAHVGGVQYIDSSGYVMGMKGSLVATCRENTREKIACTVKTAQPVKPMSGPSWTLDVTFEAPVASRAPGKPLPPDGGPAGKAMLALVTAVGGKTLAPILAGLTPARAKSYQEDWRTPAENLESAKDILGARLPKKPKVTGGELIADDHVVLEVEGVPFEGSKMLYLVEMRLIDGRWRYDNSSTAGMLQ
ncbi:MAG: hypothetical protein ACRD2N_05560 [Vicinamibacterales bacterium]